MLYNVLYLAILFLFNVLNNNSDAFLLKIWSHKLVQKNFPLKSDTALHPFLETQHHAPPPPPAVDVPTILVPNTGTNSSAFMS